MVGSKKLADEVSSFYTSGKEFPYDYVSRANVVSIIKRTDTRINIKVGRPEKIHERDSLTVCGSVQRRGKGFGKIHLS